jgi:hypothetical protein
MFRVPIILPVSPALRRFVAERPLLRELKIPLAKIDRGSRFRIISIIM